MSSGENLYELWFKLLAAIYKMVVDKKRRLEDVVRYLQLVVDREDFVVVLDRSRDASVSTEPVDGWAAEWARFYREVFGLEVDFAGLPLPAEQPGFGWMVFVAKDVTLNQAWAACNRLFGEGRMQSYYGDDLDAAVPTHDRHASVSAYSKRLRNRVEADEEVKNLSANALKKQGMVGITLLERILLEMWYYWRTGGGHLDLVSVTLCAGSRDRGGGVPGAYWGGVQFRVYYCRPVDSSGSIGTRVAV